MVTDVRISNPTYVLKMETALPLPYFYSSTLKIEQVPPKRWVSIYQTTRRHINR
jgi:hypothetical protein